MSHAATHHQPLKFPLIGAGMVVGLVEAWLRKPTVGDAERIGADLIVMASHGRRGLKRLILGSQANSVVTHSHVPILICR